MIEWYLVFIVLNDHVRTSPLALLVISPHCDDERDGMRQFHLPILVLTVQQLQRHGIETRLVDLDMPFGTVARNIKIQLRVLIEPVPLQPHLVRPSRLVVHNQEILVERNRQL
jgi:hypothetical protein